MRQLPYLMLAAVMIVFDQITKWLSSEIFVKKQIFGSDTLTLDLLDWYRFTPPRLPYGEVDIAPFLNMVMVWNKGVSFGMFSNGTEVGKWALIALSFFIMMWFVAWLFGKRSKMQAVAIALVIGGAIGNVIDRFRFGAVIDFIDFHVGNWHYPAFNVADSCICVGVGLLIIYAIFFENRDRNKEETK